MRTTFLALILLGPLFSAPAGAVECKAGHMRFEVRHDKDPAFDLPHTAVWVFSLDPAPWYWARMDAFLGSTKPSYGFDSKGRSLAADPKNSQEFFFDLFQKATAACTG